MPSGDRDDASIDVPLSMSTCKPMKELQKLTNLLVFEASAGPECVESATTSMPSEGGAANCNAESLDSSDSFSVPREDLRNYTPRVYRSKDTEF